MAYRIAFLATLLLVAGLGPGCSSSSSSNPTSNTPGTKDSLTEPATVVPMLGSSYHFTPIPIDTNGNLGSSGPLEIVDSVISVGQNMLGKTNVMTMRSLFNGGFRDDYLHYEPNGDISFYVAYSINYLYGPFFSYGWYTINLQSHSPQVVVSEDTSYDSGFGMTHYEDIDTVAFTGIRRDTIGTARLVTAGFTTRLTSYYTQQGSSRVLSGILPYSARIAPAIGFFTDASYGGWAYTMGSHSPGWRYELKSYVLK